MISGWATDTFDVVDPQTYGGKALSLACCVLGKRSRVRISYDIPCLMFWRKSTRIGLFLFSLLIDFVHVRMVPTPLEEYAVDWVSNEKIR